MSTTTNHTHDDPNTIRAQVQEGYGKIARRQRASCCAPTTPCCGPGETPSAAAEKNGYSADELADVPEGAQLGLGCGNPTAIDELRPGETVIDLGCGGGMDVFVAAGKVGPTGRVIGVDMTPDMVALAKENVEKAGLDNVEIHQGYIEDLPLPDNTADVVISNCVINLSPDKEAAFREAYRVLKPGGRLMVSDIVLEKPLPKVVANNLDAWLGCVAGAALEDDYLGAIKAAGFSEVAITSRTSFVDAVDIDVDVVQDIAPALPGGTLEDVQHLAKDVVSLNIVAKSAPASES